MVNWDASSSADDEAYESVCRALEAGETMPPDSLQRCLEVFKACRGFDRLTTIADLTSALHSENPTIRRIAIQGLIETGQFGRAIVELQKARTYIREELPKKRRREHARERLQFRTELAEIEGLLGRVYKQRCVNGETAKSRIADAKLSMQYYFEAYDAASDENLWHAINYVAVAQFAKRNFELESPYGDPVSLAREILKMLDYRRSLGAMTVWHYATRGEAQLAIGDRNAALKSYTKFLGSPDIDQFARESARRQLVQLWELPDDDALLQLFARAEANEVPRTNVKAEQARIRRSLESRFKDAKYDQSSPLSPSSPAYPFACGVARIGITSTVGIGTGFFVDAKAISPKLAKRISPYRLLITCAHVCPKAVKTARIALVFFGGAKTEAEAAIVNTAEMIWSSPIEDLDATLLVVKEGPYGAKPPAIAKLKVRKGDHAYVLGHPIGGALQLGVEKPEIQKISATEFFYETATDKGCSGGPVFNQDWQLIGVHRRGDDSVQMNGARRFDVIMERLRKEKW
jgi:S1-C subfamily serine protease